MLIITHAFSLSVHYILSKIGLSIQMFIFVKYCIEKNHFQLCVSYPQNSTSGQFTSVYLSALWRN